MKPYQVEPVKLFAGVLINKDEDDSILRKTLTDVFGEIDYASKPLPFDDTDYYEPEMGKDLVRVFYSFEKLINPKDIVEIKLTSNDLEDGFAKENANRTINIDPGYMDTLKVVLASAKYGGPKIYMGKGIYADMTLHYRKGYFYPFDWGFPDFQSGRYNSILMEIRSRYKKALKAYKASL